MVILRREESNLGNYIADKMRAHIDTDVDIALPNGGGIRTDSQYGPGSLTRGDVLKSLPFGNKLTILEVTGETLIAALENGVSELEQFSGRFLQVSGMSYTYDPSNEVGSRITDVSVGGDAVDTERTYTLATNEFIASGGDGYEMLSDVPRQLNPVNGPVLPSLVVRRIQTETPIAPERDGRITVTDPPWERLTGAPGSLLTEWADSAVDGSPSAGSRTASEADIPVSRASRSCRRHQVVRAEFRGKEWPANSGFKIISIGAF